MSRRVSDLSPIDGQPLARALMEQFAQATGIAAGPPPRRYLWTDAFAVCNFLGLFRQSGERRYRDYAEKLVHEVHYVLGRHRADDARRGWISGLPDDEGELHPTCGGLRIGKRWNERSPDAALDEQLEWDLDGQYFHYLTKWAHALIQISRATQDERYWRWAIELMVAARNAFTHQSPAEDRKRLVWKMGIDLKRVLVASMGHQDPLDGLVTCLEIQAGGHSTEGGSPLASALVDFRGMCQRGYWATKDSLGIGCLLDIAARLGRSAPDQSAFEARLFRQLLIEAECSLRAFEEFPPMSRPASDRLAFRELGLAIGIQGLNRIKHLSFPDPRLAATFATLMQYQPLAEEINAFWSKPEHRSGASWTEHEDINSVMLATSLAPAGFLAN